ncbi:MAG: succinylglutamate desuccinylase/aspartoacylase family protein [Acidobacteria bacterium]|nr:succinylglutamate desuccinylase/aspartoacylase family protein [Acidobacteriota bacterium]
MNLPLIAAALLAIAPAPLPTRTAYFGDTDHRLDVFVRHGLEPGKTILILGGIHGNESGGYKAAEQLLSVPLRRGTLIVIPHVNARAIAANQRGIDGDMNRMFDPGEAPSGIDGEIVSVIKSYIARADLLLNLHDGWGYYDPIYRDGLRNPSRYGQSVIADCESFFSTKYGRRVQVQEQAQAVLTSINNLIGNKDEKFHFSNHKTSDPTTLHPEQRKSATYYSVAHCGIPAFGIEASKNLNSDLDRVRYHLMIIGEFLRMYGVEHVLPAEIDSAPPRVDFRRPEPREEPHPPVRTDPATAAAAAAVSVAFELNGSIGTISDGQELSVVRGDSIVFTKETDIRVNVVGYVSDYKHNEGRDNGFKIDTGKDLLVRHSVNGKGDLYRVRLYRGDTDAGAMLLKLIDPALVSATIETDRGVMRLSDGESFEIAPHGIVKVVGVKTNLPDEGGVKVNLLGFRGRGDGEDRGQSARVDELLAAYSTTPDGTTYAIRVSRYGRRIGEVYLKIAAAAK